MPQSGLTKRILNTLEGPRRPAPFVVGAPRSGTTLLRLMIDSHPEIAIPTETQFIPTVCQQMRDSGDASKFLDLILSQWRWARFGLNETEFRDVIDALPVFDVSQGLRVLYLMYSDRFGKSGWGDKSPRYRKHMAELQNLFPEARFIHIIRDGRDVFESIKNLWWGPTKVAEAPDWWLDCIMTARAQAKGLNHYMEMRYEDLIAEPTATLTKVCDFLEIDFAPSMLEYYTRAPERLAELEIVRPPDKDGKAEAVRKTMSNLCSEPLTPKRIQVWKSAMSDSGKELFRDRCGQLLAQLGYEL